MQTLTFATRLRGLWGSPGTLREHLARAAAGSALLALSSKLLVLLDLLGRQVPMRVAERCLA